jgi:hypothetical protein
VVWEALFFGFPVFPLGSGIIGGLPHIYVTLKAVEGLFIQDVTKSVRDGNVFPESGKHLKRREKFCEI